MRSCNTKTILQYCTDWLWCPSSLLFNGYLGSILGVKWMEHEFDHSPPSSTKVKNDRSYTSPYMPSWHGQGQLYYYLTFSIPNLTSEFCARVNIFLSASNTQNIHHKILHYFMKSVHKQIWFHRSHLQKSQLWVVQLATVLNTS